MRDFFWHYELHGLPCGPVSGSELCRLLAGNVIHRQTRVWREGMPDWAPLEDVGCFTVEHADTDPALSASGSGDPLPWELSQTPASAVKTLSLLLWQPHVAAARITPGGNVNASLFFNIMLSTLAGGLAILIYRVALRISSGATPAPDPPIGSGWELLPQLLLLAPILVAVSALLEAGLIHLCLAFLGAARNSFGATFKTCNYVAGAAAVFAVVPVLGPVLLTAWSAFALSISLAVVHNSPRRQTVTAVFIPIALGVLVRLLFLNKM